MILHTHFAPVGFSNSYLISQKEGSEAILIDPGHMDINLLNLIEKDNYKPRHILLTHGHVNHYAGVKTIQKIYDTEVYARRNDFNGISNHQIKEGILSLDGLDVEVIEVGCHSPDSVIYRINDFYFTGDALSAGRLGSCPDSYTSLKLIHILEEKLFTREGHGIVLPGHGPPSTLSAEKVNIANVLERWGNKLND